MATSTVRRPFRSSRSFQYLHNSFRRNQSTVDIGFTPILSIYATSDYVASQLMPGHVESFLWSDNLNNQTDPLPEPVKFSFTWNDVTDAYVLTRKN